MRRLLLIVLATAPGLVTAAEISPLDQAIERGLKRIEEGTANYLTHRQCFSCHHQTTGLAVFVEARKAGFPVDAKNFDLQVETIANTYQPKLAQIRQGQGVGGGNSSAGWALWTLEVAGKPADEVSAGLVQFLLLRQEKNGSWPSTSERPPSQGSRFTTAATALQALEKYGDGNDPRVKRAIERGSLWLLENEPKTTEDRAFHLRALRYSGAGQPWIDDARDALMMEQLPDGSWAQLPGREGDAYATATVVLALREAGVPKNSEAIQKGIAYLLRTQRPDGAWIVETRSKPVQVFFDNGDPGGKSQFISFTATGWATLALLSVR